MSNKNIRSTKCKQQCDEYHILKHDYEEINSSKMMMNLIYLHGFQSNALSIKGQCLKRYFAGNTDVQVHLPDLNCPPLVVMQRLSDLIASLEHVALVGSSLGGFYATQLVAKFHVPAVLINPAMQPWRLFAERFQQQGLPYQVTEAWTLDQAQLQQLAEIALPVAQDADKILVLLQQGDEVLDYRVAQRYYSGASPCALVMTEAGGDHAMQDFAEKIPMVYCFLKNLI